MKILLIISTLLFAAQGQACLLFSFSNLTCIDRSAEELTFNIDKVTMVQTATNSYSLNTTIENETDYMPFPSTEVFDGVTYKNYCDDGVITFHEQVGNLTAVSKLNIKPDGTGLNLSGESITIESFCDSNGNCSYNYTKEASSLDCSVN